MAVQILNELGSCRISLFTDINTRRAYVHNFARNMGVLYMNVKEKILSTRLLARNFLKVIYKFEMNFQIKSFGMKEP